MSFIDNIMQSFCMGEMPAEPIFKAVLIGDGALYLQGVRAITSYSQERMEIALKKGGLEVLGENLTVKKYCAGDLVVCGRVKAFSRI